MSAFSSFSLAIVGIAVLTKLLFAAESVYVETPAAHDAWQRSTSIYADAYGLRQSVTATSDGAAAMPINRTAHARDAAEAAGNIQRLRAAAAQEPALRPEIESIAARGQSVLDAAAKITEAAEAGHVSVAHEHLASLKSREGEFDAAIGPFVASARTLARSRCETYSERRGRSLASLFAPPLDCAKIGAPGAVEPPNVEAKAR